MKDENYLKFLSTPIRSDRKPLQDILPVERPLRLLIDPCDLCNFRCEFCFQSKEDFRGRKMNKETFDLLVEQLKDFGEPINVVHLYGLGEPLINELVPYFVKTLKENNLAKEVAITTNGSLLNHELSENLVNAGTDRISISLNGVSRESFKKNVGVSVDFDRVFHEVEYLCSVKKNCHIHVKINDEEYNEEEKKKFVTLFYGVADTINIDHIVNVWPGIEVIKGQSHRMYDLDFVGSTKLSDNNKNKVCPLMFYELLVHCDGSVSPCAVDCGFQKENLGSIYNQTIKEIWNGEKLRKMRIDSLKGNSIGYQMCKVCNYPECAATVDITPYREVLLKKYE